MFNRLTSQPILNPPHFIAFLKNQIKMEVTKMNWNNSKRFTPTKCRSKGNENNLIIQTDFMNATIIFSNCIDG